jgi:hypothetical protein
MGVRSKTLWLLASASFAAASIAIAACGSAPAIHTAASGTGGGKTSSSSSSSGCVDCASRYASDQGSFVGVKGGNCTSLPAGPYGFTTHGELAADAGACDVDACSCWMDVMEPFWNGQHVPCGEACNLGYEMSAGFLSYWVPPDAGDCPYTCTIVISGFAYFANCTDKDGGSCTAELSLKL